MASKRSKAEQSEELKDEPRVEQGHDHDGPFRDDQGRMHNPDGTFKADDDEQGEGRDGLEDGEGGAGGEAADDDSGLRLQDAVHDDQLAEPQPEPAETRADGDSPYRGVELGDREPEGRDGAQAGSRIPELLRELEQINRREREIGEELRQELARIGAALEPLTQLSQFAGSIQGSDATDSGDRVSRDAA